MKKYLLIFLLIPFISTAQFGLGIGFSTKPTFTIYGQYQKKKNIFQIGFIRELGTGTIGPVKFSRLTNYGTTSLGSNNYIQGVNFGYSRFITKRIAFGVDLTVATNRYFTNYSDKRFKGGGYHLIYSQVKVQGVGVSAIYQYKKNYTFLAGFNTLRGVHFGASIDIFGNSDEE
jgi:hypothetical protein